MRCASHPHFFKQSYASTASRSQVIHVTYAQARARDTFPTRCARHPHQALVSQLSPHILSGCIPFHGKSHPVAMHTLLGMIPIVFERTEAASRTAVIESLLEGRADRSPLRTPRCLMFCRIVLSPCIEARELGVDADVITIASRVGMVSRKGSHALIECT